jgi:hypothetical protein
MSIWQNPADGTLHDDMDGAALALASWPQGMAQLTDEQALALQNPPPSATQLAVQARTQRNSYLDQLQPLYVRHKSQLDLGGTTSLTSAQFTDLLTLMEALRNVPEQAGFPSTCVWPTVPAWLTSLGGMT